VTPLMLLLSNVSTYATVLLIRGKRLTRKTSALAPVLRTDFVGTYFVLYQLSGSSRLLFAGNSRCLCVSTADNVGNTRSPLPSSPTVTTHLCSSSPTMSTYIPLYWLKF
jgi:hypothetical protein